MAEAEADEDALDAGICTVRGHFGGHKEGVRKEIEMEGYRAVRMLIKQHLESLEYLGRRFALVTGFHRNNFNGLWFGHSKKERDTLWLLEETNTLNWVSGLGGIIVTGVTVVRMAFRSGFFG